MESGYDRTSTSSALIVEQGGHMETFVISRCKLFLNVMRRQRWVEISRQVKGEWLGVRTQQAAARQARHTAEK